jgi:hypothetical protein
MNIQKKAKFNDRKQNKEEILQGSLGGVGLPPIYILIKNARERRLFLLFYAFSRKKWAYHFIF